MVALSGTGQSEWNRLPEEIRLGNSFLTEVTTEVPICSDRTADDLIAAAREMCAEADTERIGAGGYRPRPWDVERCHAVGRCWVVGVAAADVVVGVWRDTPRVAIRAARWAGVSVSGWASLRVKVAAVPPCRLWLSMAWKISTERPASRVPWVAVSVPAGTSPRRRIPGRSVAAR